MYVAEKHNHNMVVGFFIGRAVLHFVSRVEHLSKIRVQCHLPKWSSDTDFSVAWACLCVFVRLRLINRDV